MEMVVTDLERGDNTLTIITDPGTARKKAITVKALSETKVLVASMGEYTRFYLARDRSGVLFEQKHSAMHILHLRHGAFYNVLYNIFF